MKTAKTLANLTALALTLGFIPGAHAQQAKQAQNPPPTASDLTKPAQSAKPLAKVPKANKPAKPQGVASKSASKPAATPIPKVAKAPRAHKAVVATSASGAAPAAEVREPIVSRRDPFTPLVNVHIGGGPAEHLPPGKAGLVVATVRIDGAVKAPNGMIAVVSNPEQRVYFVREGDRLYDGDVEKISLDGVTFRENSKDAFGRSVERLVTKRIYSSAGEQQ